MNFVSILILICIVLIISPNVIELVQSVIQDTQAAKAKALASMSDGELVIAIKKIDSSYEKVSVALTVTRQMALEYRQLYAEIYNNRNHLGFINVDKVTDMIALCDEIISDWRSKADDIFINKNLVANQTVCDWLAEMKRIEAVTEIDKKQYFKFMDNIKRKSLQFNLLYDTMIEKCHKLKPVSPTGQIFEDNINELKNVYIEALKVDDLKIITEVDNQLNKINEFLESQLNSFKLPATKAQIEHWLEINERYLDTAVSSYIKQ